MYEYAVLRVVPRVERGEFINAGVVLYCPAKRFLQARIHLDGERLRALDPALDADQALAHLESARRVCEGGKAAGSLGSLPARERFGRVVVAVDEVVDAVRRPPALVDDVELLLDSERAHPVERLRRTQFHCRAFGGAQ